MKIEDMKMIYGKADSDYRAFQVFH